MNVPGPAGGDAGGGSRQNPNYKGQGKGGGQNNNQGRRRPDAPPVPSGPMSSQPPMMPAGPFSSQSGGMPQGPYSSQVPAAPMSSQVTNPWSGPGGTPYPTSQAAPASGNSAGPFPGQPFNQTGSSGQGSPWHHNPLADFVGGGPGQFKTYDEADAYFNPKGPGGPPAPTRQDNGGGESRQNPKWRGNGGGGGAATGDSVVTSAGNAAAYHGGEWWDVPSVTQEKLFAGGHGRQLSDLLQALGFVPGSFLGQSGFPTSWQVPAQFAGGPEIAALLNQLPPDFLAELDTFFTDLFGYPDVVGAPTANPPVSGTPVVQEPFPTKMPLDRQQGEMVPVTQQVR